MALMLGTILALAALAFVLYPVFAPGSPHLTSDSRDTPTNAEADAIAALREIEFDRETGKLSEPDYASLKAAYTRDAALAMRGGAIACSACGPRPESDALYCSSCGVAVVPS